MTVKTIRIKHFRKLKGLTQAQLSDITGIPEGTIKRWEQNTNDIQNASRLVLIADALDCSVDDLLGRTSSDKRIRFNAVPTTSFTVFGVITAGEPLEMIDSAYEVEAPLSKREEFPNSFFLIVSGDSMNQVYLDGHLVLIDPDSEVINGDIAAVNVNGFDATLKVWHKTTNTIILSPLSTNSDHEDIVINIHDPDADEVRLLGKAVWAMYPE